MIEFRIDKETPDYITMEKFGLFCLSIEFRKFPNDVQEEIADMSSSLVPFEHYAKEALIKINSEYISEFKIRKESALGQYLIENNGRNEIVDYTNYISFETIKNAMEIAIFNDDAKMSSKIIPLFQKQRFGTKEELLKEFPRDEEVLNYILENNDFEKHLAKINHEEEPTQEDKSFVVYEDGEWSIKNFEEEYVRVPKKA